MQPKTSIFDALCSLNHEVYSICPILTRMVKSLNDWKLDGRKDAAEYDN